MRINKWIIIGNCIVGIVGLGAIIIQCNSILEDIGISLLAGAIVSAVTSTLYYVYERESFLAKIKALLPQFYVNLSVIKTLLEETVYNVTRVEQKSTLKYNVMTSIAEENVLLLNGYQNGIFTGFLPKGKTSQNVQCFEDYISKIHNLKYCLSKVQIFALDADAFSYQLGIKQNSGQIITPDEDSLYNSKCVLVTIQTAKVQEYEASILQKLDEVATRFYSMNDWIQIKQAMKNSINVLLDEAHS